MPQQEVEAVPEVLAAEAQHLREEPTAEGFLEDLTNRPPRTTPEDKYYAGYFRDGRLIGALDLITGFPAPETAFVGFFMLHKDVEGRGRPPASKAGPCSGR